MDSGPAPHGTERVPARRMLSCSAASLIRLYAMTASNPNPNAGQIGLISAVSIGIGGMVGAGIFSILGVVAQAAGNAMWIAFLIGGVVALLSTYSYAKLGAVFPSAGGAVHFLVKGFRRRRSCRRSQPVHVGRLHHLARALRHGLRQLRRDLLHDGAIAAAAEIARCRLRSRTHTAKRVRRAHHGAWRNADRRSQARNSRTVCRSRPVLHPTRQSFTGPVAGDRIRPVRRGCAVHRL